MRTVTLTYVVSLILIMALAALTIGTAMAHSWYDPSCCSTVDCAPVEDGVVEDRADGVHVRGYGVLSHTDPRVRWSRDDQDHMCVTQNAERKLLCVYRKPKGY